MLGMRQSMKYDGPLRPFIRRDDDDAAHREEFKLRGSPMDGYGSTASFGGDANEFDDANMVKHFNPTEMYQGPTNGVMMQSFAPFHPHGGRHTMDMYNPRVVTQHHSPAPPQDPLAQNMNIRLMGAMPDMMMSPHGGYTAMAPFGGTMDLDQMRRQSLGLGSTEDLADGEWRQHASEVTVPSKHSPPMDPASLQKRKRNRVAQKKYRERKKCESNRVQHLLDAQKQQLVEMENLNNDIIEQHSRNAVLTMMEEDKNKEIDALKQMLAELKEAGDEAAGVSSPASSASQQHPNLHTSNLEAPTLDDNEERGIVMDIVGGKFVEDMFTDVVQDLKNEVHGHIGCERRLPLLLNVIQERLLRSKEAPNMKNISCADKASATAADTMDTAESSENEDETEVETASS